MAPNGQGAGALGTLLIALLTGGCVSMQPQRAEEPVRYERARVLLMPPQVLIMEMSAAGVPVPRVDWTRDTKEALVEAARGVLSEQAERVIRYHPPKGITPYKRSHLAAIKLHSAVRSTILTYRYGAGRSPGDHRPRTLENKEGQFDWTLGDTVQPLRADYAADYALFIAYRQITASGKRALLTAASFVLFGALSPTSQSVGMASLVDLHSGRVVWTNILRGQGFHVRKPGGAHSRGRKLLSGMPL